MNGYDAWLASLYTLTPRHYRKLLERFGNAKGVWEQYDLPSDFLGKNAHEELCSTRKKEYVERLVERMHEYHIDVISQQDSRYPNRLRQAEEAPAYLFVQGDPDLTDMRTFGIVGTRTCSTYGLRMARKIGRELSENGVTVVSGMARGIDGGSQQGAVDAGGRTIAVVGCGLDIVYPAENLPLRDAIIANGGTIVSEYAPGIRPEGRHFPARNRIIAGLSDGLLLIEGRRKSGAGITVGQVMELDRSVFVLPCQADSPQAELPNQLLREGAIFASCAGDILEDMGWNAAALGKGEGKNASSLVLTAAEQRVVSLLDGGAASVEELLKIGGFTTQELSSLLTSLEIMGIIRQLPGRRVERVDVTEE